MKALQLAPTSRKVFAVANLEWAPREVETDCNIRATAIYEFNRCLTAATVSASTAARNYLPGCNLSLMWEEFSGRLLTLHRIKEPSYSDESISLRVVFFNATSYKLTRLDRAADLVSGLWNPAPPPTILPGQVVTWANTKRGGWAGAEGKAVYRFSPIVKELASAPRLTARMEWCIPCFTSMFGGSTTLIANVWIGRRVDDHMKDPSCQSYVMRIIHGFRGTPRQARVCRSFFAAIMPSMSYPVTLKLTCAYCLQRLRDANHPAVGFVLCPSDYDSMLPSSVAALLVQAPGLYPQ